MTRALGYVIVLLLIGGAGAWLADRPGSVTLVWQGWRIDTSVGFLAFAVAVAAIAVAVLYRLWLALVHVPANVRSFRSHRRRDKGYDALTRGMVAVAAGDAEEARRQARRADGLLDDPPLTMLLSAQAAQLSGDETAAGRYFTAMLDRPETAFLGLRGLLMQAERARDTDRALDYAQRAYAQRPKTPWVLAALFGLQAEKGMWRAAARTADEAIRLGALPPREGARKKAAVLVALADEDAAAGATARAIEHARAAAAADPESLAPALKLAQLYEATSQPRHATRAIMAAWARTPHPELARLYAKVHAAPDPLETFRRLERLAGQNPNHDETHLMLAEAALRARLWGAARRHLEQAAPDERACRLMADLEEQEHQNTAAARDWLRRAAAADPAPTWVCSACGSPSAAWQPRCARCGALATLDWRRPERVRAPALPPSEPAAAAAVLPPAEPAMPPASGPAAADTR
ncbi:MAG: heme biosynthesis protein HemY [Rhodospirillales bacterium]